MKTNNKGFAIIIVLIAALLVAALAVHATRTLALPGENDGKAQHTQAVEKAQEAVDAINEKIAAETVQS